MTHDTTEPEPADDSVTAFADELAGLDVAATLADPDDRDEYRRSVPYGRDGRPARDLDRLATPPGSDAWFDPDQDPQ
ncbi:hypothetical protein [Rhodococcus artemisiae]|uniref:Uncharacterized protein n=1 Tax=Rhodococcus artemisiae TaxID=714159 RepID=A0ABU7L9P7_9NOCA|nr:hypothetical protein [Rhodococcus artemisiae]MEE2058271.1 hypothetical protein [Rhodococcus artemisiae]